MAKYCGNCGNEVDPKAVICVKCGSSVNKNNKVSTTNANNNENNNKKGLPTWAIVLIVLGSLGLVAMIILIVIAVVSVSYFSETEGYNEFKDAYNSVIEEFDEIIEEGQDTYYEKNSSKVLTGTVGDTIDTDNISVTLKDYKEMDVIEDQYFSKKPTDGNEYLVLYFKFNNNTEDSQYISDYDFSGYIDDKKINNTYVYSKIDGYSELSDTVAAGKFIEGFIVFEVNKDWKNFEVHYKDDFEYSNKTEVVFKIDKKNENQ